MPDIAMCKNHQCPLRDECYRYRAIPTEPYQTYSDFSPSGDPPTCDWFFPIEDRAVRTLENNE